MRRAGILIAALGCVFAQAPGAPVTKLDRYTFKTVYHDVEILISVRLISVSHRPYDYLPLQLLVNNQGREVVHVALANFRLRDESGKEYQAASFQEIRHDFAYMRQVKGRAKAFPIEPLDPLPGRTIRSRFYPTEAEPQDPNLELREQERLSDLIYFRYKKGTVPRSFTIIIEGLIDAPAVSLPISLPGP